jgi:hypothetical protein
MVTFTKLMTIWYVFLSQFTPTINDDIAFIGGINLTLPQCANNFDGVLSV